MIFDLDKVKVRRLKTDDYFKNDFYIIVKADDSEDETLTRTLSGGVKIKMLASYAENHVHAHLKKGVVVKANGKSQFKEGDTILTTHSAFEDTEFRSQSIGKDKSGRELFIITNLDLLGKVNKETGEITPRKGNLICEPVIGDLVYNPNPNLSLPPELKGRRRDIARVKYSTNPFYKEGDYVMIKMGGDYEVFHNGDLYIVVDTEFDDDFAKVKESNWYDSTLRRFVNLKNVKHG